MSKIDFLKIVIDIVLTVTLVISTISMHKFQKTHVIERKIEGYRKDIFILNEIKLKLNLMQVNMKKDIETTENLYDEILNYKKFSWNKTPDSLLLNLGNLEQINTYFRTRDTKLVRNLESVLKELNKKVLDVLKIYEKEKEELENKKS
jgi:hypothetical protein